MKIYWSYKQVPELASLTPEERKAAVKQFNSLAIRHWEWWAALPVAALLAGLGAYLGGRGLSGVLGAALGGGLGGGLVTQVVIYIGRKYHSNTKEVSE